MKLKFITFLFLASVISSCEKSYNGINDPKTQFLKANGFFLINEGNFRGGNGSLSFYSTDSAKIYNDIFTAINNRPLGDVPNSMTLYGDKGYIVVNNSGKLEVVEQNSLKSITTISNIISPRIIKFVNNNKAYVSSLYSDSVIIIDPSGNSIGGYINIRRTSEAIEIVGNKAFVANWSGGNEIMIINTLTNCVVDSIKVALEPESMAVDKNRKLWVLCTGGYINKEYPELIRINTSSNEIEKRFVFPDRYSYPSNLSLDDNKDELFWLDNGVKKMNIIDQELPVTIFIPQKRSYFYKMGVEPVTGDVFVTDGGDYQQKGKVFRFNSEGVLLDSVITGIIPSTFCFKLAIN
jgi:YVTN family beta-propeller protein